MKPQLLPTLLVLLPLAACTRDGEPASGPGTGGTASTSSPPAPVRRIEIPSTVRSNLGITFAKVEARRVAQTIRVPGAFELRPLARHEYRMALPGRVQLLVDQYETVEAGRPLFRFQSPAWPELLHEIIVGEQAIDTAHAEIAVAQAKIEEARRKHELITERIDALANADFKRADLEAEASELNASLPRLEAELELARTRLKNAGRTREHALHRAATAAGLPEERLESTVLENGETLNKFETIDWIDVLAVDAGVVEMLAVTDGAFVEPPTAVLSTVDPRQVRFRALALQGDLTKLSSARGARIVPPRSPDTPIEEGVDAELSFGLEAHPRERTLTLLATPDAHAPWIRPGVSAFLEIVVESTDGPSLAIPRSAVVQDGLEYVFFRRDPADPNTAIRVEADLGISDGRWVALNSGVMRGDEVVLAGAYELTLATKQSGAKQSSGHVHADGTSHTDH